MAAAAVASPYNRDCGTARDGFLTTDEQFESSGPLARQDERQHRPGHRSAGRAGEFQPPGSHPPARQVRCVVAEAIASYGANAWTHWSGNDGRVTVQWIGYASGPSLGSFQCTGVTLNDGAVKETCVHRADRHAGAITDSFTIERNPNYPYPTS
jgi:hypothetical protein